MVVCCMSIMSEKKKGKCEKEQRILLRICCRLCFFILLDNRKEGLAVRGGRSPN